MKSKKPKSDFISFGDSQDFDFSKGDFTVDFWVKFPRFWKLRMLFWAIKFRIRCWLWSKGFPVRHPDL